MPSHLLGFLILSRPVAPAGTNKPNRSTKVIRPHPHRRILPILEQRFSSSHSFNPTRVRLTAPSQS